MNILLMDDEDQVRRVTTRMLEFLGHKVVAVSEGSQAVETLRSTQSTDQQFDLAILDLRVESGKGGKETLTDLREVDPDLPAVASSGFSDDSSKSECIGLGFNWYLPKPMTLEEIQSVLLQVQRSRK